MTTAEAVKALDELTGADPEISHDLADALLLDLVPVEVRDAYHRLQGRRCAWWATA